MVDEKIDNDIEMYFRCSPFWRPSKCTCAMQCASPNAACPGLLWIPLEAAIGQLLAPYCPNGCRGNSKQNSDNKMCQRCWPFWWPWRCAGAIPRALPNLGGPELSVEVLIVADWTYQRQCFQVFSLPTCWKQAQSNMMAPNNNRGMTYWTDGKHLR